MMLSDVCLTTSVAYIVNIQCAHSYWKQARWAPQARRKACMGWSWAAARGVQGWGHIVAVACLQLVLLLFFNYRNRLIFAKVIGKSLLARFLWTTVYFVVESL